MSIETYVRFRPVGPLDQAPGDPVRQAKERWRRALTDDPSVIDFAFQPGRIGPPKERDEAKVGNRQPVDITIEWDSLEAATRTFGDNSKFEYLCGYVVGAPQVVVEGEPQIMEQAG